MTELVLSPQELRARMFEFEAHQKQKPQVEIRLDHVFFPGGYARTMYVPAGTDITGAIHKYPNFNILVSGEVLVVTESGPQHLKAPFSAMAPPGTKRAGQTLTYVVWTTILATDLTDVALIESTMVTNSEEEYLAFIESTASPRSIE
jgi:hypothetical protein